MMALAAPSDAAASVNSTRRVVLVQERDDVAAPDAQFGQRAGQSADPVVPLRPGPGAAR